MCSSSGGKIVLYSIWYRHIETSEWSKIAKIQLYKYEQIVVKFIYEFFGYDYCKLLTINILCCLEVMFIQLLNLLKRYILQTKVNLMAPELFFNFSTSCI